MYVVSLEKMEFVTFIGLFPEELLIENNIEIEIEIGVADNSITDLPFIDYGLLYDMVEAAVAQCSTTLEELVHTIYANIAMKFKNVKQNITVKKLNPPIKGRVQASKVCWKEF